MDGSTSTRAFKLYMSLCVKVNEGGNVGEVLLRILFEGVLPGSQNHGYYTLESP